MKEEQGVLIHEPRYDTGGLSDYNQDDRMNVSKLHRELQHRALKWLANRAAGAAYGAVEIPYLTVNADALALFRPNNLFDSKAVEWQDRPKHWMAGVALFEAKATRSDFMSTFGPSSYHPMKSVAPGHFKFLVKPARVTMPLELLPAEFGVLEAYGTGLRIVRPCRYDDSPPTQATLHALWAVLHYGHWGKRQLLVACPDCAGIADQEEARTG